MGSAIILVYTIVCSPALQAESLGRLFTTPAQRADIDRFKSRYINSQNVDVVIHAQPKTKKSQRGKKGVEMGVIYNGLVKRSNGINTVWVNGQQMDSTQPKRPGHHAKILGGVSSDNSVVVKPVGASRSVRLKPGQKWMPGSSAATKANPSLTIEHTPNHQRIIRTIRHK